MATLNELGAYLQSGGHATPGTDLFYNEVPAEPGYCVVLTEYGGREPEYVLGEVTSHIEFPRVQVFVRCGVGTTKTVAQGWQKAEDLATALSLGHTTLGSTLYFRTLLLQQPFFLRRDENNRTEIVFNIECHKRPS